MHWDYLKRWTNFRRQLSKRHVTPKINFCKNKKNIVKFTRNPFIVILCFYIDILWLSNKARMHYSTQTPFFNILHVNFTLSTFYEFLKSTATLSTFFTLYDVWNAFWQSFSPFELRSCRLRPFNDVKRYNYMLACAYCIAWTLYANKEK